MTTRASNRPSVFQPTALFERLGAALSRLEARDRASARIPLSSPTLSIPGANDHYETARRTTTFDQALGRPRNADFERIGSHGEKNNIDFP